MPPSINQGTHLGSSPDSISYNSLGYIEVMFDIFCGAYLADSYFRYWSGHRYRRRTEAQPCRYLTDSASLYIDRFERTAE